MTDQQFARTTIYRPALVWSRIRQIEHGFINGPIGRGQRDGICHEIVCDPDLGSSARRDVRDNEADQSERP